MSESQTQYSHEYAICPFCGHKHGDCWEWCNDGNETTTRCDGCDNEFCVEASHSTTYRSYVPRSKS